MGIAKSVLNEMNILTELFFVEAGATTVGDIREITNIVHPNIGVITSIGPQHLNTFKTMNNVLKTKLELSDSLPPDGKLILNYHNQYLNGLVNKNIKETLTANSLSLHARNIVHHDIYTEFDIYSYNKFLTHIKTKLLGELFIHNIIICYAVKLALDELYPLSNDEFQTNILQLTNPNHRLSTYEITKNNTIYRFIDDSFNSNTEGFIQAVKVLKHLNGLKVLITPGIVDSGKHSKMIAEYLTPNLKELDDIVLVNNKEIKYLKQALLNNNINYYLVNSFNEALNYIYNKYSDFNMEVVNILLENDLPDNYLMR
jgi:UDP-N-acetylmuramoyl-tripeptide--D-alanyl-D-alanine ligase